MVVLLSLRCFFKTKHHEWPIAAGCDFRWHFHVSKIGQYYRQWSQYWLKFTCWGIDSHQVPFCIYFVATLGVFSRAMLSYRKSFKRWLGGHEDAVYCWEAGGMRLGGYICCFTSLTCEVTAPSLKDIVGDKQCLGLKPKCLTVSWFHGWF